MAARQARVVLLALVVAVVAALLPALPSQAATACSRGAVALTFDDGPHPSHTPRVLDILRQRGVKATFFQVGSRIAAYPSVTRRVRAEGHVVANHTWNHESLTSLTDAGIRSTLQRTNSVITNLGLPRPTLARPPYGATSSRVRAVIEGMGMRQVLWTVDPQDWRGGSASAIASAVLRNLRSGAIILLHDGVANSPATIAALPAIIDGARARGYCFTTLSSSGAVTRPRPPRPPSARIGNVQVTESNPGKARVARLTVTLSKPTSRSVSMRYRTVAGTATAGADFVTAKGTLTFPAGTTKRSVGVRVKGDRLDERRETFTVVLSRPSGATLADRTGRVRVIDNDRPPSVRVLDAAIVEPGPGSSATATLKVSLSARSGKTITVAYATADGTATAPADYARTRGTLTLAPGATSGSIPVRVTGDDDVEGDETVRITVSAPSNARLARAAAVLTVVDDDAAATA